MVGSVGPDPEGVFDGGGRPRAGTGGRDQERAENTFSVDTEDRAVLRQCLREQADDIAGRLERRQLAALTVQVKVRYTDFTTLTRQISVEEPVGQARDIYRWAAAAGAAPVGAPAAAVAGAGGERAAGVPGPAVGVPLVGPGWGWVRTGWPRPACRIRFAIPPAGRPQLSIPSWLIAGRIRAIGSLRLPRRGGRWCHRRPLGRRRTRWRGPGGTRGSRRGLRHRLRRGRW